MKCKLIQDKSDPTAYHVEAMDEDGGCEVAIFSGPNALDRAIDFAAGIGAPYYCEWADPDGHATPRASRPASRRKHERPQLVD